MPCRLILRGGDELFVTLSMVDAAGAVESARVAGAHGGGPPFILVPLVPWTGKLARSGWVRGDAVDAIEPVDEDELEAHRRDRAEWIEHGGG